MSYESLNKESTNQMESPVILTLDTYNVPSVVLSTKTEKELSLQLSKKLEVESKRNYESAQLAERLNYKNKLEEIYNSIKQKNSSNPNDFSEARLHDLEKESEQYSVQICFEEMKRASYENMLTREKSSRVALRARIEEAKIQLKKTEDLRLETNQVSSNHNHNNLQRQPLKSLREDNILTKLENSKRYLESLNTQIEGIKTKTEQHEQKVVYDQHKKEKLIGTINSLKFQKESYRSLIEKHKKFEAEYIKQYHMLMTIAKEQNINEVTNKKEEREIQAQSESNKQFENICKYKFLSGTLWEMKQELKRLKEKPARINETLSKEIILDKGEYNPDAVSRIYVKETRCLEEAKALVEEKLEFFRRAVGGVKSLLLKLQEVDINKETGKWRNLDAIAQVDEIYSYDTRPNFSQLLLILEWKVRGFYTMISQKVFHMLKIEETYGREKEDVVSQNIPDRGIVEANYFVKSTTEALLEKIGWTPPVFQTKKQIKVKNNANLASTLATVKETSSRTSKSENQNQHVNSRELSNPFANNISSKVLNTKLQRGHEKVNTEIEKIIKENDAINSKFLSSRAKKKFEVNHYKEKNYYNDMPGNGKKAKKVVSELTLQIEKEMSNCPPSMVNLTTETFEVLDKIKKSASGTLNLGKTKREKEFIQRSMPNFVSVVLSMKKARKGETIEKIASKCHLFPVDYKPFSIASIRPNTTSGTSFRELDDNKMRVTSEFNHQAILSLAKRIEQLKSLKQIEGLSQSSSGAFEDFCSVKKRQKPQSSSQQRIKTSQLLNNHSNALMVKKPVTKQLNKASCLRTMLQIIRDNNNNNNNASTERLLTPQVKYRGFRNIAAEKPSHYNLFTVKNNAYLKAVKIYSQKQQPPSSK